MSSATPQRTKRVIVDHFGGPEVLRVVEEDAPQPGPGEVRVKVLAAGVSFTDSQLRAGTYLGVPKPPRRPEFRVIESRQRGAKPHVLTYLVGNAESRLNGRR